MEDTLRLILKELQNINSTLDQIVTGKKVLATAPDYTDILDRSIDKNSMVSTKEIIVDILQLSDENNYRRHANAVADNMRRLGFDLKRLTIDGAKQYVWGYIGTVAEVETPKPVEAVVPITREDLILLFEPIVAKSRDKALELLAKYNVKKLSLIDQSLYPAVLKDLKEINAGVQA